MDNCSRGGGSVNGLVLSFGSFCLRGWIGLNKRFFIYVPAANIVRCAEIQKNSMVHCAGNNDFAEKDSAKIHHLPQ